MSNKFEKFQNEREETDDIPIGIPVNVGDLGQNGYDPVAASKIKFRKPTAGTEQNMRDGQEMYQYQKPMVRVQSGQFPHQNFQQHQGPQIQQMSTQRPQAFIPQNFDKPQAIKCPCCKMDIVTVMNYESGNTAYLWAGGLCLGTLCCCTLPCCCCVPFMSNNFMDRSHYCPACGFNIIRKHRGCCDF